MHETFTGLKFQATRPSLIRPPRQTSRQLEQINGANVKAPLAILSCARPCSRDRWTITQCIQSQTHEVPGQNIAPSSLGMRVN